MSSTGRVISIFAAVAMVTGGSGYYFFKIYRPAQVRADARDEIAAWELRFTAARACLLGPTPGSPKTSEALAIREMTPDPWDRGSCTRLISKLSRGEAPDTGLPKVEVAWTELDRAAASAAKAFAMHVGSSTTLVHDPLPQALDALDHARLALRVAAGLPAARDTGAPLREARIVPLLDGSAPLTELEVEGVPSAHGFITFGKTATRAVQINFITGSAPTIAHVGPGSVRSAPAPTWGASVGNGELHAGAFDAEGAIATPSIVKLADVSTIAAVIGSLSDGEIVFGGPGSLVVARTKGGAVTAEPPVAIDVGGAITDVDGRAIVAWTKVDHQIAGMHARVLGPGADETTVDLPSPATANPCLTATRAWILGLGEMMALRGKVLAEHPTHLPNPILMGCTAEAALLRDKHPRAPFEICIDPDDAPDRGEDHACREVKMPAGAPELSATTVVAGKLVAIASHGGVLGVWHEQGPPVFYGLPEPADPVLAHEWPAMAMTDGKVIDVIARGTITFVVIRIPAS